MRFTMLLIRSTHPYCENTHLRLRWLFLHRSSHTANRMAVSTIKEKQLKKCVVNAAIMVHLKKCLAEIIGHLLRMTSNAIRGQCPGSFQAARATQIVAVQILTVYCHRFLKECNLTRSAIAESKKNENKMSRIASVSRKCG